MKSLIQILFVFMCISTCAQTVKIKDKNFEKALIDLEIDTDGTVNGLMLKSDAQEVVFLDISGKKIRDLKGIEAFTSLIYLYCKNNQLSRLDISKNINLTNLLCDVNDLTTHHNDFTFDNWFEY